jgi:hypothetical protein
LPTSTAAKNTEEPPKIGLRSYGGFREGRSQ